MTDSHKNQTPPSAARKQQMSDKNMSDKNSWQQGYALAWGVLGAAPTGLFIGYFIDQHFGTTPAWMLGLSLLFLALSLYQLIKGSRK
jgi:F0F1-type ATP synthase assembly protein I